MSADYYPEDEKAFGHIEVDLNTKEISYLDKAKGYEYSSCPLHAKKALLKMTELDTIPKEKVVMWY